MAASNQEAAPHENAIATPPSAGVDSQNNPTSHGQIRDEEKAETEVDGGEQPPASGNTLLIWNKPRINLWRFLVTLFCFLNLGANDAAYGALLPYVRDDSRSVVFVGLEIYYGVDYTVVALVFLAPFLGYTLAAFLNNSIHMRFGQRGIAMIAPCCKLVAYVVTSNHPPYAVLPIIFIFSGFGNGLEDGGWNAWVGGMANANELMGILHGAYGLGATIAPLVATAMVVKANLPWYTFYYVLLGTAVIEFIAGSLAFWNATGSQYRLNNARINNNTSEKSSSSREALTNKITWLVAAFLLCYVGVEVSLGGWLVEFMLRVRHGGRFESGLVVTGYWLGLTVGRVILGFVTGRIGEKLAITGYLLLTMALELLFWLVPSFTSSAIFAGFLGFFLGPLFPAAILVASKLLPRHLHVSAIGFAAAFGGGGAAALPFVVGAIAQAKGVQVLQPIVLAFLAALLAIWAVMPGGFRTNGLEEARIAMEQRRSHGRTLVPNSTASDDATFVSQMRRHFGLT